MNSDCSDILGSARWGFLFPNHGRFPREFLDHLPEMPLWLLSSHQMGKTVSFPKAQCGSCFGFQLACVGMEAYGLAVL